MPESYKTILVSSKQGVLILTLQVAQIREYDISKTLEEELIQAAESNPARDVIVDFSQVELMSSVGYLPFVGLRASVDKRGGRVIFCSQSATIKEMFEATRMLINPRSPKAPFEYRETLEESLALLTTGEPNSTA